MILANLPHDNLYKFLAFAGLTLLVASNYLYFSISYDLEFKKSQLIFEREDIKFDLDNPWTGPINRDPTQVETPKPDKKKSIELRRKNAEVAFLVSYLSWLYRFTFWGSVTGAVLMIFGIIGWYRKVQGPQDKILALKYGRQNRRKHLRRSWLRGVRRRKTGKRKNL